MCKTLAPALFILIGTRLGSFRSAPAAARPLRRRHLYRRICGVRLSNDGERAAHHLSDEKESIDRITAAVTCVWDVLT